MLSEFFSVHKTLFWQKLFGHLCFSSVSEKQEALPQLHFLLKSRIILEVLLFWPWVDFELNAVVFAHVSNEVQMQVCPSTAHILWGLSGEHSWLWEQPLTAPSHLPLQFSDFFTPRKKHKQLIKVYTEMLDEEVNNLSGCLKWQVQNKRAWWHYLGLSRIDDDRLFINWIETAPFPCLSHFPMEQKIIF